MKNILYLCIVSDNNRYYTSPLYAPFQAFLEDYKKEKGIVSETRNEEIDKLLIENRNIQLAIDKNTTAKEKAEINKLSKAVVKKINKISPNFLIDEV